MYVVAFFSVIFGGTVTSVERGGTYRRSHRTHLKNMAHHCYGYYGDVVVGGTKSMATSDTNLSLMSVLMTEVFPTPPVARDTTRK